MSKPDSDIREMPQGGDLAARARIAAAAAVLAKRRPDMPGDFASRLFALAAPEDIERYSVDELAGAAEQSWTFLAERPPGAPKIRLEPLASRPGTAALDIVNDDMPFLVDSVLAELHRRGFDIRLFVHPVFAVERDRAGRLTGLHAAHDPVGRRESFIHLHLEGIDDAAHRTEIVGALGGILADVRVSVADWWPMLERIRAVIAELRQHPPPLPVDEIAEAIQFLEWLAEDNFTFLGARDYTFADGADAVEPDFATGLGLLRSPDMRLLQRWNAPLSMTPDIRAFLKEPRLLIVAKSTVRSRVHRRVHLDYIGIKRFDRAGALVGEHRFCGLFTSTAYTRQARTIPYLRRKIDSIIRRAEFDPSSHSGKALVNVLETYPRDELFQIDEDLLYRFAIAILQLDERPRVRVLPRLDRFERFVSVLVFVPRDRYGGQVRAAIGEMLANAYRGRLSAYYPFFPEGPLVRVQFIIARAAEPLASPNDAALERGIEDIIRSWADGLRDVLATGVAPDTRRAHFERYGSAFPIDYREIYSPSTALADIAVVDILTTERPLGVALYRETGAGADSAGLKVFSHARPIPLSERVPVLENMGFRVVDERTYRIEPKDRAAVWFHDMVLQSADGEQFDVGTVKPRIEACFLAVMSRQAESDGYNALVLAAGLDWRDVALIRAISRFLRQIRVPYSQDYMWATLRRNPAVAAQIVVLFRTRFAHEPGAPPDERAARERAVAAAIEAALQDVASLDEDLILRHFRNAVEAAVRTNFYQPDRDGRAKDIVSVKFASRKVDGMPLPRPLYEIFVYSPRFEGVHLRFGKVARGGIRWSDRPQDFRTEVLGLVKAQNVKNAVIVPVGAKGGFVPKLLPAGAAREAVQAEGVATYKLFISALLDLTDNIGAGTAGILPPPNVVRHDRDDPYLVVAADKGTATFSDIANDLAAAHDYWLGDAFASGGSSGYDHKKIGITARGAWEAVKRHFREMDVDIAVTPFTAVGVGDMSGDVFGNGMLRERTIRLVGAFDHRDIFIDPDPDAARSFAERKRLFDMPRSSWQDYDTSRLSSGGGIYSRKAKEIALSPQAQRLFGVAEKVTPQELIRAILKAAVDLIYFGGIGTYVRAAGESDADAGDRSNDAVRVSGADLRCKVIGEGANLAMTQRARIEAARRAIRLNTDAIDNSAGVNTSDMEVNIKIALSIAVRDGRLTLGARDALLAAMTDEVAALVLRNNYLQTLALSLSARRGMEDFGLLTRLIQLLEARGLLDRSVEFLPDDMQLAERQRRSEAFTRPELAVLLAYAKLALHEDLLDSAVPDDPYLERELRRYFPGEIAARFPDALEHHRLRRDIVATHLGNSIINRGGPSLVVRIADQTGAAPAAIAYAFAAVRDSYGMTALNGAIDKLDNKVSGKLQLELYSTVQNLLLDRIVWFLRNVDLTKGLADVVAHYRDGIAAVASTLDTTLSETFRAARASRGEELRSAGVSDELAGDIANLRALTAAPDIVLVADRSQKPVEEVAATYFAMGDYFRLDRVGAAAAGVPLADYFDRMALDRARDGIGDAERRLTAMAVRGGEAPGRAAVAAWAARKPEAERVRTALVGIVNSGLTLSKLSVAAGLLGDLAEH